MAINSNDFIPRPGFVNKQGCLPDPLELCCIQVPKIFDQCLIRRCLKPTTYCEQLCQIIPDIADTADVKKVGCCHDFDVKINSITKSCIKGQEGYKRVVINFTVTFSVDVETISAGTKTLNYTVNQTINIPKFYAPEPIAEISIKEDCLPAQDGDNEIIKLEVVADCLGSVLNKTNCGTGPVVTLCVTLGLFIIVKSELVVQLLIPCYGYCPIPPECPGDTDLCKEFMNRQPPSFYPPQKMDNLFSDYIDDTEK